MGHCQTRYRFVMPGRGEVVFDLRMDASSGRLVVPPVAQPPQWTALEFRQCSNCPLKPEETPLCPVAHALADVVPRFEALVSYDQLTVIVETEDRTVSARRDVQGALSSMIGLIMASSGCPHTSFFRPMARFHLPLSNEQETTHRVVSNWLLAQHLGGAQGPVSFDGLLDVYEQLQVVNAALTKRLSAAGRTDSALNAVVLLDLFALLVPAAVEDSLSELKALLRDFHAAQSAGSGGA